jgi:DNA polymerase I-like protein with 3'-5' exonuclease and polymerase domains
MFGVAISAYDGQKIHSAYYDIRQKPQIMDALRTELPKCKKVINHNMKFDSHFLINEGVEIPFDNIECTSVRAALINEHEPSFKLGMLGEKYVGMGKVDIYAELAALFGGAATPAVQMKNLHRAPASLAGKYAIADPEIAIKLWLWQEEEIKRQELGRVWDLERRLTPILVQMERNGVRVDEDRAHRSMDDIDVILSKAQQQLNKLAGGAVNANSPLQLRNLFKVTKAEADNTRGWKWVTDNGFELSVTDGGEASLAKESLLIMTGLGDKRAEAIMTLRRMGKARSFLKDHIIGHAVGGRVYPNYNQTRGDNELGTGTGRFSIDDPALQQIPARDADVAAIVRACFLPEEGEEWACADWEQFEFRWFAHYTKDPKIMKAYHDDPNTDYHKVVSDITGIPRNPAYAGQANAKQINLGLVFGMGEGELAYHMGLEYTTTTDKNDREWKRAGPQALDVFSKYHTAIPGVKKLLQQASSIAKSRGFVKTVMDRHIRFPGGRATYKAGGLVFQGTSADCMKQKMIEIWPIAKKEGFSMLLSVHDELDFSFPKKQTKRLGSMMKKQLEVFDGVECPIHCRVPILSSVQGGVDWFDASKKK